MGSRVASLRAALERVAVFIVLGALWEWAVDIFAIKPYLLPALSSVLRSLWQNRLMLLDQALQLPELTECHWGTVISSSTCPFGSLK
jgi:ABC-type nitrate/sulfonate/bicarbonate transport system permease component